SARRTPAEMKGVDQNQRRSPACQRRCVPPDPGREPLQIGPKPLAMENRVREHARDAEVQRSGGIARSKQQSSKTPLDAAADEHDGGPDEEERGEQSQNLAQA